MTDDLDVLIPDWFKPENIVRSLPCVNFSIENNARVEWLICTNGKGVLCWKDESGAVRPFIFRHGGKTMPLIQDLQDIQTQAMKIVVYGTPAPQGSKKFVGIKCGHGMMIEVSKRVKPWREDVKAAAMDVAQGKCITGPVRVRMIFTLKKPKSAPKRRRTWPDRSPDLSKLIRSTEDALTQAGVWEDDARVVHCSASKVFPGEGADSLAIPGAVIFIEEEKG